MTTVVGKERRPQSHTLMSFKIGDDMPAERLNFLDDLQVVLSRLYRPTFQKIEPHTTDACVMHPR